MTITFAHPAFSALFILLGIVWYFRRGKNITHVLIRSLLVTLITLALMEPVALLPTDSLHQVVIVDQSQSMSGDNKQAASRKAEAYIESLPVDTVDIIVTGTDDFTLAQKELHPIAQASLSLTQAVSLAIDKVPYGQRGVVTLFSDGNATDDHWESVLARLKSRNIALNWIKYDNVQSQPSIQSIDYSTFYPGQTTTLTVKVQTSSALVSPMQLRVVSGNNTINEITLEGETEGNLYSASFEIAPTTTDFLPLSVSLVNHENQIIDTRSKVLAVQSPVPILLGSQHQQDQISMQALLGNAFKVTHVPYPWSTSIDFTNFDAVILNNAAKSVLPDSAQTSLSHAVTEGTGLLYTGSEPAFSTNGLSNGALAKLLPVRIDNTDTKREPGISLAIIIDSSGSMQGQPLELAKQVARLAVRKLKPQDQVGIVEFYGTRQWAIPMQPVNNTDDLERAIGKLQAQGGSELFPAIEEAYFGLKNSHNKYRHILLITDAAVEEDNYQKLLQYIASDQINVSTVLVGDNASGEERMSELANWGKGRFYAIYNEFSMVELNFSQSDQLPASAYQTGNFTVRDSQTNTTFPIELNGYTRAPIKPSAVTQWAINGTSDTLLASWYFGTGKVSALMTEPLGQGTQSWANWPQYGQQLGDTVASLTTMAKKSALKTQRTFDKVHVQFETTIGINTPLLQWKTPDAPTWSQRPLRLRAPGLFSEELDIPRHQAVLIMVNHNGRTYRAALEPNSDLLPEFQNKNVQPQRLPTVVKETGGQILTPSAPIQTTKPHGQTHLTAIALMPFALLASLLVYFIDIIYRRWPARRSAGFAGKVI